MLSSLGCSLTASNDKVIRLTNYMHLLLRLLTLLLLIFICRHDLLRCPIVSLLIGSVSFTALKSELSTGSTALFTILLTVKELVRHIKRKLAIVFILVRRVERLRVPIGFD